MAHSYIESVTRNTEAEIVSDRFHVPQELGQAVNRVRREDNQENLSRRRQFLSVNPVVVV